MEADSTRNKNISHILLIEEGESQRVVELKESVYTVGRDATNSIALNSRGGFSTPCSCSSNQKSQK